MIKNKLAANTLLLQLPIGESSMFSGMIDLINMEALIYGDASGKEFKRVPIQQCMFLYQW